MQINQALGAALTLKIRSSHAKLACLFALIATIPAIDDAATIQAAQDKPVVLTFAQLAANPITGLVFQDPVKTTASLTENIRLATGKAVQVTGYMLPLVMENGRTRELLLMRNTMGCCYGQTPAANEYLVIRTATPGLPVTMDIPVALQGNLRVTPITLGGMVVEFYHLDNAVMAAR